MAYLYHFYNAIKKNGLFVLQWLDNHSASCRKPRNKQRNPVTECVLQGNTDTKIEHSPSSAHAYLFRYKYTSQQKEILFVFSSFLYQKIKKMNLFEHKRGLKYIVIVYVFLSLLYTGNRLYNSQFIHFSKTTTRRSIIDPTSEIQRQDTFFIAPITQNTIETDEHEDVKQIDRLTEQLKRVTEGRKNKIEQMCWLGY